MTKAWTMPRSSKNRKKKTPMSPTSSAAISRTRRKADERQRQYSAVRIEFPEFRIPITEFPPIGAIAQLGERLHGMQEVGGSIPPGSTNLRPPELNERRRAFLFTSGGMAGRLSRKKCRGLCYMALGF